MSTETLIQIAPPRLWTSQRMDIAVKLLYARHYLGQLDDPPGISIRELYRRHILLRTNGHEPGSATKNSVDEYERVFRRLIDDIRQHGFQPHGAVPLYHDGRILNGAHRVAASIALGIPQVPAREVQAAQAYDWGMHWFLQHGFTPHEINTLLRCWLELKQDACCLLIPLPNDEIWKQLHSEPAAAIIAWRDFKLQQPHHCGTTLDTFASVKTGQSDAWFRVVWAFIDTTQQALLAERLGETCQYVRGEELTELADWTLNESLVTAWCDASAKPHPAGNVTNNIGLWLRPGTESG